jgi:hypothetical protein
MANLLPAPQTVFARISSLGREELVEIDQELARVEVRDLAKALARVREELARDLAP